MLRFALLPVLAAAFGAEEALDGDEVRVAEEGAVEAAFAAADGADGSGFFVGSDVVAEAHQRPHGIAARDEAPREMAACKTCGAGN